MVIFFALAVLAAPDTMQVPRDLWLDCQHRQTINDVGVCDDAQLMAMDDEIRKDFDRRFSAAASDAERAALIFHQRQFRDSARFCEGEPPCLLPLYRRRLADMKEDQ